MIILFPCGNNLVMIFFLANKILKLLAKLSSKNKYEFASEMSDEDAVRNIGYLAHNLRKTARQGAGVPLYPIKLAIKECPKIVLKKRKMGLKVYDFEEWIADNFRLLMGMLGSIDFNALAFVPHVDGVPRIVVLADFIVKYSGGKVTRDRAARVLEAFNAVTPLGYNEIACLKDAVAYRLLVEISFFAERSLHYFSSYLRARKKKFSFRDRRSDSYLTYYAELHKDVCVPGLDESDFRAARLGLDNLLADNLLLTSSYVDSLRFLGGEFDESFIVSLSLTDRIYKREACYEQMSFAARHDYLMQTAKCAERNAVSEQSLARAALELADALDVHFGEILYYYPEALKRYLKTGAASPLRDEKTKVQGAYAFFVLFFSLLIAAFPAYYLRNLWGYLSVLPLFVASLHPVEYLLKRAYGMRLKKKPLPQMDFKTLPEECRTVVTVSRFIANERDARDALFQAETLAAGEKDPAVRFAVLADLPSSKEEWGEKDAEILASIKTLRRSSRVSFFLRKRVKCGKIWRGYERKRGAILEFLSAVQEGAFDKFHVVGEEVKAEYAILLDDDSELLPGMIRSAVLAMAHPLNKEYDLMSFGGRINRFSIQTHYGLHFLRCCGVDAYPYYSDFYSDAFDCALYCGKAIVRIRPYLQKLKDSFPDGRILSHDIIEGALLRSTSLKRCVYEDAPATFCADCRRSMRWQRGDVQLLPYAFCNRVKTRDGKRVKNPIAPIYKLIIFINGISVLREFMLAAVLLIAYFSGANFLLYYALSCLALVKVYALVSSVRTVFSNVRFSHAFRGVILSLELLADELILLPFRALSGAYLFAVTSFKMAVGSKTLLDWTPFKSTQKAGGAEEGAKLLFPTALTLSALCIAVGNLWLTLYVSAFFLYALYLLLAGRTIKKRPIPSKQKEQLKAYAAKIYRYFEDNRDEGLITDNLQLFPYRMRSSMTSPTNLGFALLAEVCACKTGLISERRALENVRKQLDLIEKLERYCGHLYNWYDVKTLKVMPPKVISTVDSANFLCCLRVVASFAREANDLALETRANAFLRESDFSVLYNRGEKCLAIVRNTEENRLCGRYDLLASESRLAYYLAIEGGVDAECYFALGRECSSLYGNTLLSWSGTAFEYMLPRLFLHAPIGSLIAEQEFRSGKAQVKDKTEGVFGRSECGYYAFNDATAFLYKAVGCANIALSGECSDVIAPYASFLYLPCFPKLCLENLRALAQMDAEGEYGFYEAIDFDHQGDVVKSYMTHHQGMSLAAITNALTEGEIVRLFSDTPQTHSIRLLLAEENVYRREPRYLPQCMNAPLVRNAEVCCSPKAVPDALSLGDGEFAALYDALGGSRASLGGFALTKNLDHRKENGGVFIQVEKDGEVFSPAYYPYGSEKCYALFRSDGVKYVDPVFHTTMEVSILCGYNGELRKLVLENPSDEEKVARVSVYADMALNTKDAYDSHPAFSDMFVTAEHDEATQTEYLYRKNAECRTILSASLTVKGLTDCKANCNSYNVIGRKGSVKSDFMAGVEREDAPRFGDVLYPCFAFSGKVALPPCGKAVVYLCMLADRDLSALKERNGKIDLAYRSGAIELLGKGKEKETKFLCYELSLTGKLLYERTPASALAARRVCRNELEAIGVLPSDDLLYFDCAEDPDRQKLLAVTEILKSLRERGINHKFLVVCDNIAGAGMDAINATKAEVCRIDDQVIVLEKERGAAFRSAAKIVLSRPPEESETRPDQGEYLLPEEGRERELLLPCGEGGFTRSGYAVKPFNEHTLLPYANVVGSEKGGFVVTESGGGFTFGENAREDKLTLWTGDALRDEPTEVVALSVGSKRYALNFNRCEHQIGASVFTHLVFGVTARLSMSTVDLGRSKLYEVVFTGDLPVGVKLSVGLLPALGWRFSEKVLLSPAGNGYELFNVETGKTAYFYCLDGSLTSFVPQTKCGMVEFIFTESIKKGAYRFVLSVEKPKQMDEKALAESKAKSLSRCFSNAVTVHTQDAYLNLLNNFCLPYQAVSARLNAKTGFYQCGGAYGFRDQLQDCLAILLSDPDRVKEMILLAAAHQYREGDAQHWWHPPKTGVRTRISDDRLWLAYVTERYVETTGDHLILDQAVPFLSSPILTEGEVSRYEIPREGEVGTLREHIYRAINISLQYGEHGLLKMGTGDWNDGLDRVGAKGRGESVWLTMFAYKVIKDGADFFRDDIRAELLSACEKLSAALFPLLKEGRYSLAFADDGKWLGYPGGTACNLALNPQTWAVLSGAVPLEDAKRALFTAKRLAEDAFGIVKLSSPPFDRHSNYGYVAAYPKGVRENGGQYTHAAVWYLKALLEAGEKEEAYRVLTSLCPMTRCKTQEGAKRYMAEPYVLAGDVYGCEPYVGRAGWTWYTGSAAWLKYVLTEDFFGVKKRGDYLYVKPNFPSCFDELSAEISLFGRKITVLYQRGGEAGLFADGKRVDRIDLREVKENVNLLCRFD